jgi:hypothetical protein
MSQLKIKLDAKNRSQSFWVTLINSIRKLLLGNFNMKAEREDILKLTKGKHTIFSHTINGSDKI